MASNARTSTSTSSGYTCRSEVSFRFGETNVHHQPTENGKRGMVVCTLQQSDLRKGSGILGRGKREGRMRERLELRRVQPQRRMGRIGTTAKCKNVVGPLRQKWSLFMVIGQSRELLSPFLVIPSHPITSLNGPTELVRTGTGSGSNHQTFPAIFDHQSQS